MKKIQMLYNNIMDKILRNLIIIATIIILICAIIICAFLYLYPLKYKKHLIYNSVQFNIAPEIIASIINAESGFNPNAVSGAGAIGLMQLMPSTAKEMALELQIDYEEEMLYDPATNILLGTAYFSKLLQEFKDLDTAICAYNAGPNRVKLWLKYSDYSLNGIKLTNTPFPATNYYLDKIKRNISIYSKLF